MEADRLKSVLEALLFAADGPLPVDRLRSAIDAVEGGVERKDITLSLKAMQAEYEESVRGFRLVEVANGFQLRTASEHAAFIKNLLPAKAARMSRANLETLAIIAYKQPVTRAEIEDIRGVSVDAVISTLLERRLIRIVARKDVPGKPFLYGTTREFLETFNLKDLTSLPTLKEMEEITQTAALEGEREDPLEPSSFDEGPAPAEGTLEETVVAPEMPPEPSGDSGKDPAAESVADQKSGDDR